MIEKCTKAFLLYFKRQVISRSPSTTKHPDSNHCSLRRRYATVHDTTAQDRLRLGK